ncbi:phosphodiesterase [Shouchella clausii]|uniref:alkaline phosphatase family protein n=1 Tax=Shouchella clausii TaxID=79880 RepID=UPI000BA57E02|nr:alkaline phosphatase family protein [Shouchella clausii]MBU8597086.1 alkaline phosphatase family protein [Shouchella clausii]MCY1104402.1 alkaline phosphatase family protein [Shouchella clausii]PAD08688.1 phosphodiesterase [Shouchella clausii]PAE82331.1 phosphodiesterase [Shouchella clausii]PAF05175.1 phosphodiesterase [Shouchella clausii]
MKKKFLLVLFIVFLLAAVSIIGLYTPAKNINQYHTSNKQGKPVIVLLVDSLMDEPLQKAVADGNAPAFEFLMNAGRYYSDLVSSYPTMSVTIDSTLLTGTYANGHRIPGLAWFKTDEKRLVNYGSGLNEIIALGVKQVTTDSMLHLNQEHLNKQTATIYEELASHNLEAASLNGLIYRGPKPHTLTTPNGAAWLNMLPKTIETQGPSLLSMGAFSHFSPKNDLQLWKSAGLTDAATANELVYLIEQNQLPAFTLAYFPELDKQVHKHGSMALKGILQVDKKLQTILNTYRSWEEALEKAVWIVCGDSGQAVILDNKETAEIDLNQLLSQFTVWNAGDEASPASFQIVPALNARMTYLHLLDEQLSYTEVAAKLTSDARIGFVAWSENGSNYVSSPKSNELFTFSPNGDYVDPYQQTWSIDGDETILGLTTNDQNAILFDDYPDALARLHGALHSHDGRFLIADALPGYEFIAKHTPKHTGGAGHGSLHKLDSTMPFIIAGTDVEPDYRRLVDFKQWVEALTDTQSKMIE